LFAWAERVLLMGCSNKLAAGKFPFFREHSRGTLDTYKGTLIDFVGE
jgi:hypothetical protein